MQFIGCTFIAFGPPFAIFCLIIASDPIRIIILISRSVSTQHFNYIFYHYFNYFLINSSFFWLLSLLLSSILWSSVVPLKDYLIFGVTFSVIFQESFRYLFYRVIRYLIKIIY